MSAPGYRVFKVHYKLALPDPFMSGTLYHNVIFVETESNGDGTAHNVTGDIATAGGMKYESKPGHNPENSATFHERFFLGYVRETDYPGAFEQCLRSQPPPPRQRWFNPDTMAWEKCKPDGTLYAEDETPPPYRKCTAWTTEQAIPALKQSGILRE
ncbi:hypothetical protein AJ78_00145 [Emergomyces pasteurianus Ep9510]|uniref:Uncharacterized protein n=1 Tax=Emergomyces pasteurianus Ep9510 TaxID=1447872 RepID=A0A1J9QUR9_9EURO|nr:hypothetical protein AJ78_00145 [Emergomyces pasteurianus Ep9510]